MYRIVDTTSPRGFFSHVLQVISSFHAHDMKQYKLAVDWSGNHDYLNTDIGPNVWNYYFEQPCGVTPEEARNAGGTSLHLLWDFPIFLNPTVRARAFRTIHTYFRFKANVMGPFLKFRATFKALGPQLGVHVRRTDHIVDAPYLPDACYFEHIDKETRDRDLKYILLATDCAAALESFQSRYGKRLLFYPHARRSQNGLALHHQKDLDGYAKGLDVLLESMLLSETQFLLKTVSNVSHFSVCFNQLLEYKDIDTHLIRTNS